MMIGSSASSAGLFLNIGPCQPLERYEVPKNIFPLGSWNFPPPKRMGTIKAKELPCNSFFIETAGIAACLYLSGADSFLKCRVSLVGRYSHLKA